MASAESSEPRGSDAARNRAHRARDTRPIQFWVPDVRSKEFLEEAHRQSLAVATSAGETDDQSFVDSIADFFDE